MWFVGGSLLPGVGCKAPVFFSGWCLPAWSAHVSSPGDALLELICFALCKEMPRKSLGCRKCPRVLTLLALAALPRPSGTRSTGCPSDEHSPCPHVPLMLPESHPPSCLPTSPLPAHLPSPNQPLKRGD